MMCLPTASFTFDSLLSFYDRILSLTTTDDTRKTKPSLPSIKYEEVQCYSWYIHWLISSIIPEYKSLSMKYCKNSTTNIKQQQHNFPYTGQVRESCITSFIICWWLMDLVTNPYYITFSGELVRLLLFHLVITLNTLHSQ